MADTTMFLRSDHYYVEIVGSDEDSLFISDGQGGRVYVAITDQLKDRLSRICQDWAFENEMAAREAAQAQPVCDHCGEPVEQSPGGLYWTHTTESRQGHRFACIIYGQKMHTDAAVNGSDLAYLVPDPS